MRIAILLGPALMLTSVPAAAQMDPGAVAAGEAVRYDNERRSRVARGQRAKSPQTAYERWRNRPGKRDCGSYNWKCPAKSRRSR